MKTRARLTGTLAAAALLAGISPAGAAPHGTPLSAAAPCNSEQVVLRTFHVDLKLSKKIYKPGDRVKIDVAITRPAKEDPAGLGQPMEPPMTQPAAGVDVGAGINVGDVFVYDVTQTDTEGKALLSVKLPRYTPKGRALIDVLAREVQARTTCAELVEMGYRQFPSAFAVKR